jgi:tetratricopeptide (TPR) repeat protein
MGLQMKGVAAGLAIAAVGAAGAMLAMVPARIVAQTMLADAGTPGDEKSSLTPSRMFQVLAADLAVQRGEYDVAAKIYLELANSMKDARLAKRAAQAATLARQPALVLEAAKAWANLEPESSQARNTLAAVLISQGPLAESKQFLVKWIAEASDPSEVFRNLNRVLGTQKNRREVFDVIREVAAPYDLFDAHMAVAQAAIGMESKDGKALQPAVAALDRALQLQPGSDTAAELNGEILVRYDSDAAIKFLTEFGIRYPDARNSRYLLARILLAENKPQNARETMLGLVTRWPDDVSMQYVLALASYETKDYSAAERVLVKLLDNEDADHDRVLTLLGQVHEDQKRYADALARYRAVGEGDLWFGAQQRIALALGKLGQVDEARAHLQEVKATAPQKIQLALTEGNLLREANRPKDAFEALEASSKTYPESSEILYDLAMAAEKIDKLDAAEAALKKVIAMKPEDAQGYNALGYTLVDRTDRVEEGLKLIEKAHAISPEDAFILDSLGWGYYRLGQYAKSIDYLKRALAKRQDPEVAAHLGEVLWKTGQYDEAEKIWRTALVEAPSHPVLTATIKKFAR